MEHLITIAVEFGDSRVFESLSRINCVTGSLTKYLAASHLRGNNARFVGSVYDVFHDTLFVSIQASLVTKRQLGRIIEDDFASLEIYDELSRLVMPKSVEIDSIEEV